jgi:hypothetical protein
MKKTSMLFVLVSLVSGAAVCSAGDFTANMTISARGEKEIQGKLYMQGNKMRMEMGEGEEKAVTITRPDKKVIWVLMPEEEMYIEQAYQEDPRMKEWTPSQEAQSKLIGNETVSGLNCKKYQVQGKQVFYWISEKISFPVKTQDPEGTMLLKNIQAGKVPDDLFTVPKDFEKVNMPGMGGMPHGVPGMPKGR